MKKHFFYTDPTLLSTQTSAQAFGPAQVGDLSQPLTSEARKDKYRITNLHTGTDAPAIAVCDGMICVQEDLDGTYSIILKPNYQPPFDFPYIKYYIYKGIDPASLKSSATSNEILDNSDIPFLEEIRDGWEDPNADNPIAPSADVTGLAYNPQFTVDGQLADYFNSDKPIDNFFYYPNPNFQLPSVKAGKKIGEFASNFGFEIVLERLGYEPKIELARTFENFVSVDAIGDSLNVSNTWHVDDEPYFMHWHEKEECLNYIDPCAFYGSFCGTKVFYFTATDPKVKCNTPQEIYDALLLKFINKNLIYLDVRNQFGLSKNYFKNSSLEYKFLEDNTLLNSDQNWPIRAFRVSNSVALKKYSLRVRTDSAQLIELLIFKTSKKKKGLRIQRTSPNNSSTDADQYLIDEINIDLFSMSQHVLVSTKETVDFSPILNVPILAESLPFFMLPALRPPNFFNGEIFRYFDNIFFSQVEKQDIVDVLYKSCVIWKNDTIYLINYPHMVAPKRSLKKQQGETSYSLRDSSPKLKYYDRKESKKYNIIKKTNSATGHTSYSLDQSIWVDKLGYFESQTVYDDILAIKAEHTSLIQNGSLALLLPKGNTATEIVYGLFCIVKSFGKISYSEIVDINIPK